ncbi:IS4 family transposase ISAnsp7 [Sorangium sp. Soce836]|nr:IS4 family transposase ISAnsp7 [Sorangium sp. Soce836]
MTVADSLSTQRPDRDKLGLEHTREFVDRVFGADLHALRVLSLANGVAGVLNAAVLSIHAIGQAYANVAKITAKSGVKQVDRMLGNDALSLDIVLARWVRFVVGENASILIALDWTDFDKDDHTTLCAYMVTTHGRAMPLAWKTVKKSALKDQRTGHELEMVERLHTWLPENVNITLLADRAFGYQELYALLEAFGWDFVIRFRGCILVESAEGAVRPAEDWVPSNGRPKLLVGARVTDKRAAVGTVVLVKAAHMKEA